MIPTKNIKKYQLKKLTILLFKISMCINIFIKTYFFDDKVIVNED